MLNQTRPDLNSDYPDKLLEVEFLKKQIPLLENNLSYILSALAFLFTKINAVRANSGGSDDFISPLLDELDLGDPEIADVLTPRLQLLFKENSEFRKYTKVRQLRAGLLPNALSFRTMLDLRPDFGQDESLEFQGLVKIIQFKVTTDSDDPAKREFVFQLDDSSLVQLVRAVDRLKTKLSTPGYLVKMSRSTLSIPILARRGKYQPSALQSAPATSTRSRFFFRSRSVSMPQTSTK
ncbi:hypothetical protein HU675_0036385 [Bradyrhizobium septentrionale]|uniref:hypothetical protein n=1 Tax=Bradyrhizobium septentrionale TaxID=1404411 RepID=UPI001596C5D6|nr:hypothetical protein [Bradyrhizobium septentrionale]UGY23389.1 hypothetical protein HU675_0036385 [Bradyrhizobium septentrionale]